MSDDEAWFDKEQRELKQRSLLLTGPGGGTWQAARGPMGKSGQTCGVQAEGDTGSGAHTVFRVHRGSALGFLG